MSKGRMSNKKKMSKVVNVEKQNVENTNTLYLVISFIDRKLSKYSRSQKLFQKMRDKETLYG